MTNPLSQLIKMWIHRSKAVTRSSPVMQSYDRVMMRNRKSTIQKRHLTVESRIFIAPKMPSIHRTKMGRVVLSNRISGMLNTWTKKRTTKLSWKTSRLKWPISILANLEKTAPGWESKFNLKPGIRIIKSIKRSILLPLTIKIPLHLRTQKWMQKQNSGQWFKIRPKTS